MKSLTALVVVASLAAWPTYAAAPSVTGLEPIPLRSGVNQIPALAADGRPGIVVLAWRDNGNAHGFDLALVLLQSVKGGPWNVVRVEGYPVAPDRGQDVLTDDPHTGEDVVATFRLARGKIDGIPATLLLMASRAFPDTGAIPDPSLVTFRIYRLEQDPQVGTTPDHFTLIAQEHSTELFCNAEMALSRRFRLPLRPSYGGPMTATGC